jgi:beta-mannosidase
MHRIDLNGPWRLRWNDGQRGGPVSRLFVDSPDLSRALTAQVPGEVHLDLIRAGLLAEPTLGLNCLAARWVEETQWYYQRSLDLPALAPDEHAFLTFEGLDLFAVIYVNGHEAGRHDNAFYPCQLDVTEWVHAGENSVVVALESGLFAAGDRPATGYGMSLDSALHKRNWLRKTQSSFGWDWSTRLINVGIHGRVYLDICSGVHFERAVVLARLSDDLRQGVVSGRVFVEGLGSAPGRGTLTVSIEDTGCRVSREVDIVPGANRLEASVTLEDPQLWWPAGHGAQPLYTVTTTLSVAGQVVATATRKVGFRHMRVDQSPHPEGGNYFIIEINHKPIFVKGGNFVPADMIFARLDRARYATLVDRALEANFNLLRIWGGGLYESDDLYEICDERGVLIWQEFIFACAKYPIHDDSFLAGIKREATYQVRRLAHHPSLVVWCGNNEMKWGAYNWNYERGVAHPDYALFHMVLPVILKQEDGTRYYQPSSPYSPDHELPNRDDMGDQHPWNVGFANTDYRDYRQMACRFPNEGGILGPTALPTMLACLPPVGSQDGGEGAGGGRPTAGRHPFSAAQGALDSFGWEIHDNGIVFGGDVCATDAMLTQWLGLQIGSLTLEEFAYYGGALQGEGLAEYIRNFRRRMFSTASAIFWMYNDNWPATRSWTIVDYYLRRTPAFHPVRRAFQPSTVAIAVEDDKVRVFGVNEGGEWQGELRCGLFALAGASGGGYPVDIRRSVRLPANASTMLTEFELAEWQRLGESTHGAFALLSRNGVEVARDRLFLPFLKDLAWPAAHVTLRMAEGKAIFESESFAWRVCLDLGGEQRLPDNFFDVLPGIPTVLDWPDSLGLPHILRVGNLVS